MAVPTGAPTRADTDAKVLAADALVNVRLTQTAGCDSKMSGSSSDCARSVISSHAHRATTKNCSETLRFASKVAAPTQLNHRELKAALGCYLKVSRVLCPEAS